MENEYNNLVTAVKNREAFLRGALGEDFVKAIEAAERKGYTLPEVAEALRVPEKGENYSGDENPVEF